MVVVLILFSITIGAIGLLFASQATAGPTIVGFACLLAIYARCAQAEQQHKERKAERAVPEQR
jgi:membrane-bound ClpP family serine protease